MHQPVFLQKGPLVAGSYLPGLYVWTTDVWLESAKLIGLAPGVGPVVLTLEIGGSLTATTFTLNPSELSEVRQSRVLGVLVSAGQAVRWQITSAPGELELSAHHVTISLAAQRGADMVFPAEPLTVWWQSGLERLLLFTYDPTTHAYTAVNAALAAPRASISSGVTFSVAIQGGEVLRVASHTLYTATLVAGGLLPLDEPQLQFYVGAAPVAVLTALGILTVPGATQSAPVTGQINQFLLGSGAAFNATGLVAENLEQPL